MHHRTLCLSVALSICCWSPGYADVPVPNPSFEEGESTPSGWSLNRGRGELVSPAVDGRRAIAVIGDGNSDNAWISDSVLLEPDSVYRLQFQARRIRGAGGTAVSGPLFCNRDLGGLGQEWTQIESYFVTPQADGRQPHRLRFGQWKLSGEVAFDNVRLTRVIPVYESAEGRLLGRGEMIQNGKYSFSAPLGQESANHARPLAWHTGHFNTNRWSLSSPDTCVVYRHKIGSRQLEATIDVEIGWHQRGELVVEVRGAESEWQEVGTLDKVGSASFAVPSTLLPADEVWVRFSARNRVSRTAPAALQLYAYRYEATLEGNVSAGMGKTHFLAVNQEDPALQVSISGVGEAVPGGKNKIALQLRNTSSRTLNLEVAVDSEVDSKSGRATTGSSAPEPLAHRLEPGAASGLLRIPYHLRGAGSHRVCIRVIGDASFAAETTIDVPALHASDYGQALPGSTDELGLWWCSSGWKVSARRGVPSEASQAVLVSAAANETEAVQLVLRPQRTISDLRIDAGELVSGEGHRIPRSAIETRRVAYVHITRPTDATGAVGQWPDPLPPLREMETAVGDRNFPLWVCVHVPPDQPAGLYRGTIALRGTDVKLDVPLLVEVFGFTLPDRMTCKTAFGLSTSLIWRYHGLKTESQRREVLEKYLQCLSRHHISPYQPAPLDPIRVTWKNLPVWSGGQYDSTQPHSGTCSLRLTDESSQANTSAWYQKKLPVSTRGFKLRFWHRTAKAGHPFIVTLQHYDADGRWMSGRNRDLHIEGSQQWQQYELTANRFPAGAKTVQLHLRATVWDDAGTPTGTVWFDDVSLVDLSDNKELITGGGFERLKQPTPTPVFDFSRWDIAMRHAIDQLYFNTFRLAVPGLGGGTFHARYEPELLGYSEETPQYQAALKSYLEQLQAHLREKGWLDESFVYWFDEPDPKDYEFVNKGFAKLKRWAPDIPRMLTEQVEPELVGGPSIWCPVTSSYDPAAAETRRQAGDEFWWYVCTGPKAPFCTLFIDHPGTEMRVWLWQTWQHDISGILVWATNYWTSSAAYPDQLQNPHADPMSWVSGYSTPGGTRRPWGNGDGRFLYPPESIAQGSPDRPVLTAPVSSIRLEMLRDGIEDYEYLALLRRLLEERGAQLTAAQRSDCKQLLSVPAEITTDMTNFTTDPRTIESRRRAIGKAIELLTR